MSFIICFSDGYPLVHWCMLPFLRMNDLAASNIGIMSFMSSGAAFLISMIQNGRFSSLGGM